MRRYSGTISLSMNSRDLWSIDTVIGCASGMKQGKYGCYDDCYSARASIRYGYDFSNVVLRFFRDEKHKEKVISKINKIEQGFIRIGNSGDPSENWPHAFEIIKQLEGITKPIVIITKHWKPIPDEYLLLMRKYNIIVNTSVSALDEPNITKLALKQYERLKPFCKSVLRIVTCDFNTYNPVGFEMALRQDKLLLIDENYIDTVFRPSSTNKYVLGNVINVKKKKFLKSKVIVSKLNKSSFLGSCVNCNEKCGAN